MLKEMEKLEQERQKEELEIKQALQKEQKYNQYLEKQRGKLQEHRELQVLSKAKDNDQERQEKRKERERLAKEQRDQEKKKKMVQDYKQKKLITEELLANADLDNFMEPTSHNQDVFDLEGDESNEEEANAVMD